VFILALIGIAQSKPIFTQDVGLSQSASTIRDYIAAFVMGLDIFDKVHPSAECVSSSDAALTYASAGIDNINRRNFYEGTLNISDSLGALSPLARHCNNSIDELARLVQGYPQQFSSVGDFFLTLGMNILGNLKPLLDRTVFVINHSSRGANTTASIQTMGEIIKITFTINPILRHPMMSDLVETVLRYTWGDPLAPTPINPVIWNTYESIYNLLVNSRFISEVNLLECQGATLNMILFNQDAANNFNNNNERQGILSVLDSFQFLHQAIEGCTHTAIEVARRSELIDKEVLANPSVIWKNTIDNLWFVFSAGVYGYAMHYHSDIIHLIDAVADFFFRTITYRVERP